MTPYDANTRYLGPQSHWLNQYILTTPPSAPELYDLWNHAAYLHDKGYEGDEYAGFWGWIKKVWNREKVEAERAIIDNYFSDNLYKAIEKVKPKLSRYEIEEAYVYANIIWMAVAKFGFGFYKTGNN